MYNTSLFRGKTKNKKKRRHLDDLAGVSRLGSDCRVAGGLVGVEATQQPRSLHQQRCERHATPSPQASANQPQPPRGSQSPAYTRQETASKSGSTPRPVPPAPLPATAGAAASGCVQHSKLAIRLSLWVIWLQMKAPKQQVAVCPWTPAACTQLRTTMYPALSRASPAAELEPRHNHLNHSPRSLRALQSLFFPITDTPSRGSCTPPPHQLLPRCAFGRRSPCALCQHAVVRCWIQ